MKINDDLLKHGESVQLDLRGLYRSHGYTQFKMNKFEEYDLYMRNKDFLVSDAILTFTDTNGRLMALKPDVTLSIIKNSKDEPGITQKVFYNENVYRVSRSTHAFREILQTGLECIGDLDLYSIAEVVLLAAKSLQHIRSEFVLDISHMGVVLGLIDCLPLSKTARADVIRSIGAKNLHEMKAICAENGVSPEQIDRLAQLVTTYGNMNMVLERLQPLCTDGAMLAALKQLKDLAEVLTQSGFEDRVRFDFSVVNDMNYYNGLVFQGFVNGVPNSVLSGGQYDKLMQKMGRNAGAIGFAVYMDQLERLDAEKQAYDFDVLLLYDATATCTELAKAVQSLTEGGATVRAAQSVQPNIHCRHTVKLQDGRLTALENDG